MKSTDVIVLALAGLAVYFITQAGKRTTSGAPVTTGGGSSPRVDEILNTALPGQAGWGWHYYSDGTAIGPDGKYYLGGQYIPGT